MVALVGDDRFLKQAVAAVIESADSDNPLARRVGSDLEWQDLVAELATISLFSSGPRRVLVSDADDLVSKNRSAAEQYARQPSPDSVMLLDLKKLASNTNLYKQVVKHGTFVDCKCPQTGKNAIDKAKVFKWLSHQEGLHRLKLQATAREVLAELVDLSFGRCDQELAKLALFAKPGETVNAALVEKVVGGWRTQTTWAMIDKACGGEAAAALLQLDHLIQSGESPQALFGSIAWSLRRFAAAVRLYEQRVSAGGRRPNLKQVLQEAGCRANELDKAEAFLKQIGRERAGQLYHWLLEADLAMKGSHAVPARARFVLEHLILRLAKESKPAA